MLFKKIIITALIPLVFSSSATFINYKNDQNILSIKRWTKNFLHYIQNDRFIIFKDDFDLENLTEADLEKLKPFADNWIFENISFFNNNVFESYADEYDYNIAKKMQLTGFKKILNDTIFELFFNFKNDEDNENSWKEIKVTFDIFNYPKSTFVDFFNNQLEHEFLEMRELPFENLTHNIQEWIKTRSDFFWKIKNWNVSFNDLTKKVIQKINEEFSTKIIHSNSVLFFSWENLDDDDNGKLIFNYQRFDIKVKVNFKFYDFYSTDYFSVLGIINEKNIIRRTYNIEMPETQEFDYLYTVDKDLFLNFDIMDKYLDIYSFLNKISHKIMQIWTEYFLSQKMNARIVEYTHDFLFDSFSNSEFDESGQFYIEIVFSTLEKKEFLRKLKINW